jgi:GNAT superfamily N-acetyltransferase
LISRCDQRNEEVILHIINESAKAYRGIIAADRYHEPYMSLRELREEMREMTFFGYEEKGTLLGVVGYQPVKDVTLVRHLYVLPSHKRRGIGGGLLNHVMRMATTRRVLVGTWEAAEWAVRFYEKRGFKLLPNKDLLLKTYWRIPDRQIKLSVVLGIDR